MKSVLSLVFVFTFMGASHARASGCDGKVQAIPGSLIGKVPVTGEFSCTQYSSTDWSFCRFTQNNSQIPVLMNQAVESAKLPGTQKPVVATVEKYEAFLFNYCEYDTTPDPVPPANGCYYKLTVNGVDYTATENK